MPAQRHDHPRVKVGTLEEGDTFELMGRFFIVRGKTEDGRVETECLDDGGTPALNPEWTVDPVTTKKSKR